MNQQLTEGQAVYDSDGTALGTIKEVRRNYVKLDVPMAPDYWLRAGDLTNSASGGQLRIRDGAEQYSEPADDLAMDDRPMAADRQATATNDPTHRHATDDVRPTRGQVEEGGDDHTLELREEQLRVAKEREQAGEVRLGKRVEEHTEQVDVPLREEQVVIERQPGSGQVAGAITDTDETIEVPVMRERAVVDKEAVVREEVTAHKEATERTERVQGTVQREELVVEGDGETINAPRLPEYEREETRRS
jgi:uncharacterized protein (TIGR02271 family)